MTRVLSIPVTPHKQIDVHFPAGQLTQGEWDVFMSVLDSMWPALVKQKTETEDDAHDESR